MNYTYSSKTRTLKIMTALGEKTFRNVGLGEIGQYLGWSNVSY